MSLEAQECEGSNIDAGGGPAHGADAVAQCQCCTVPVAPPSATARCSALPFSDSWNRPFPPVASWRCPRVNVGSADHDATVTAFLRAAADGNLSALLTAPAPDVVLTSDGGGQVRPHGGLSMAPAASPASGPA